MGEVEVGVGVGVEQEQEQENPPSLDGSKLELKRPHNCDDITRSNKKQAKEVSNDDIRSEVSNPTLASPKDNHYSTFQDITSQPPPQPQFPISCGEVSCTSSPNSSSSSEHTFSQHQPDSNHISTHTSHDAITSRVVLDIPKHAAFSGIRKITFKFSKRTDNHVALPHQLTTNHAFHTLSPPIHLPDCSHPNAPNFEFKMSNKVVPTTYPSNVKKLLSTGILDAAPVKYVSTSSQVRILCLLLSRDFFFFCSFLSYMISMFTIGSQKQLKGIISGGGYLCGCSLCDYTRVSHLYVFNTC